MLARIVRVEDRGDGLDIGAELECLGIVAGIEGIEIEDNVPLSESDTSKMFIDILPELPPDQGIGYVSFYLEAGEDHSEKLKEVAEAFYAPYPALKVVPEASITENERICLFDNRHSYRGDRSAYMLRSTMTRVIYKDTEFPPHTTRDIVRGDV